MFPIWHQANVSTNRATPADISALLELNEIPYIAEPSTTIKDHTCFMVGPADTERAVALIEQETGRFNIENQEIEVTEEERAAIDSNRAQVAAEIAEKERLFNERKAQEAAFIAKFNANLQEEDEEENETIDELIAKEEEE